MRFYNLEYLFREAFAEIGAAVNSEKCYQLIVWQH